MLKELLEELGHEHKEKRDGEYIYSDKAVAGTYEIPLTSDYKILRFPKLDACVSGFSEEKMDKSVVTDYITSNARHMANKLRIKLQTRSKDRYEYGLKKGKLHTGSIHRLLSGDTQNAQRIFRQKKVSDTLDTAVCLLVDCSGSMAGKKFNMAAAGAGTFSAALKPLNIAHSVLGFSNTVSWDDPMLWVFSDYNERISETDLINRFGRASACLWENTDGDAIAYAYAMLSARKEKRKVLLVLSDGDPAGRAHKGSITSYTRDIVKKIEGTNVDIYGIGIMHDSVKRFYKNYKVVNDLNELTPAILNILDRSI
jgi:cobalamin biosynthesis protein CobT